MTAKDCSPSEVGKTGLGISKLAGQKWREPTGASCSTATKLKTPRVITSEFAHMMHDRQSCSAGGVIIPLSGKLKEGSWQTRKRTEQPSLLKGH